MSACPDRGAHLTRPAEPKVPLQQGLVNIVEMTCELNMAGPSSLSLPVTDEQSRNRPMPAVAP